MSGKIKKIKLIFNKINISYNDGTTSSEILKIKQVEFGNLNVFNSGDRRDKINVSKMLNSFHYYKYNSSNDNTNGQTEYTLNIHSNTTADLLLVAGGGGGGCRQVNSQYGSGGGGAGGLVFELNKTLYVGTYTIKVGKGGRGSSYNVRRDNYIINQKGKDTIILYGNSTFLLAKGGGQGGNRNWNTRDSNIGKTGGSSGGSSYYNSSGTVDSESVETNITNSSYGNEGGSNGTYFYSGDTGGGGGGAGSEGTIGTPDLLPNGGSGISSVGEINFKEYFGITDTNIGEHHTNGDEVYFAGGGGGCRGYDKGGGQGGIGGGGDGEEGINIGAINGEDNTGGGGGGGRVNVAGNGGSGIVIIRLKAETSDDTNLQNLIDNDNNSGYEINLNDNNILIFNLNDDIDRKNILNSLNQIIFHTEKNTKINDLNYDVILENDEGEEILFETIDETSPDISLINDSYSKYTSRYFNLFTEERLYPPYIFRDLPILTNKTFIIRNRLYGNGSYNIKYSSYYDSDNNPLNIFKNDFTSFTWGINNYNKDVSLPLQDINLLSTYNNTSNINGYEGDFISIRLPIEIILTKFVLVIKNYNNVTLDNLSNFPMYFKIFGKNNENENIWKEIVEVNINKGQLNNIYNDKYFINSYNTRFHTYNYQGTNDYKEYRLIIENYFFCDILIVGGGGAGGRSEKNNRGGGGGGAGGLIYMERIFLLPGTYIINVGNGGQESSENGFNSSIISEENSISFIANGGGGGGNTGNPGTNGKNGGSGGGGADYNGQGGISVIDDRINSYGNNGGRAVQAKGAFWGGAGAGGGGALLPGGDSNSYTKGLGGSGKIININISGSDIEYAKGGDGGAYSDGNGYNGLPNTGNGGNGAGKNQNRRGGKGGSGIVIIKEYINYYNSYKHVFDETNRRQTGLEKFNEYALVINKIGGGTNVDFGTWEIYGKEKFSVLNEVPTNVPLKRNIKFSHLYKVFEGQSDNNTSNISMENYINYTPQNNSSNLSFSTFKGLSIDSELPVTNNILARYIPNNIYMKFSQDNNIIEWNDIYNNSNINTINIHGSPSIQNITPNSNGLYTDNQRMTISTMKGTKDDIIEFPFTLQNDYTFCYIARYTGDNNKRIFNSKNDKTYWCFNNDKTCTSMYNNKIYSSQIKQISDNNYWIIGIETGDTMRYNGMDCTNYIYDSTYYINNSYEYDNTDDTNTITINGGSDENYKGSWEIGELIFYNKKLTESQKIEIERYFAKKYYHISFTSIVQTINDYQYIISNNYSINSDNNYDTNDDFYIWYNIYDGNKYAYSKLNSRFYGPANYLFDIQRYKNDSSIYYYWILFVENENTDNTNKFLEVTIPNSDNNLYLIALAGGGSAGSYNDYSGDFKGKIISGPGNAGELKINELDIEELDISEHSSNITLQLQVGHGGKMIEQIGRDGGDSIITIKDSRELLNSTSGTKGLDYDENIVITSVNGGTISSILNTYKYDNSFSLDNILTYNYTYWNSDFIVDDQQESGKFYGYGAPGVIMNNEYSGSSGIVAIIQSYEIFRNI